MYQLCRDNFAVEGFTATESRCALAAAFVKDIVRGILALGIHRA